MGIETVEGKKLTIKFMLNTELKPIKQDLGPDLFPVYVHLTYDRKSTKFKYSDPINNLGIYLPVQNDGSTEVEKDETFKAFEKILTEVIQLEVKRAKGKYRITGIGDRMLNYALSITASVAQYIQTVLNKIAMDNLPAESAKTVVQIQDTYLKLKSLVVQMNNEQRFFEISNEVIGIPVITGQLLGEFAIWITPFSWFAKGHREMFKNYLLELSEDLISKKEMVTIFSIYNVRGKDLKEGIPLILSFVDQIADKTIKGTFSDRNRMKLQEASIKSGEISLKLSK